MPTCQIRRIHGRIHVHGSLLDALQEHAHLRAERVDAAMLTLSRNFFEIQNCYKTDCFVRFRRKARGVRHAVRRSSSMDEAMEEFGQAIHVQGVWIAILTNLSSHLELLVPWNVESVASLLFGICSPPHESYEQGIQSAV